MGTASIKYPVPDRVKPPFVIFDIRALWTRLRDDPHSTFRTLLRRMTISVTLFIILSLSSSSPWRQTATLQQRSVAADTKWMRRRFRLVLFHDGCAVLEMLRNQIKQIVQ